MMVFPQSVETDRCVRDNLPGSFVNVAEMFRMVGCGIVANQTLTYMLSALPMESVHTLSTGTSTRSSMPPAESFIGPSKKPYDTGNAAGAGAIGLEPHGRSSGTNREGSTQTRGRRFETQKTRSAMLGCGTRQRYASDGPR